MTLLATATVKSITQRVDFGALSVGFRAKQSPSTVVELPTSYFE